MPNTRQTQSNTSHALAFVSALCVKGTAACPPYHLAIVIGGTSAEFNLKTVKAASTHDLDALPTKGSSLGHGWRDLEWEKAVLQMTQEMGIGAQFGGKYFCHDVRVVRLPRHGASCPVGIGVSCSADRQIRAKITAEGLFLERLETDPAKYLPHLDDDEQPAVDVDLRAPMAEMLQTLSRHPVSTRVNLTGPLIVARDIAHAKWLEVMFSSALGHLPGIPFYLPIADTAGGATPQ